MAKIPTVVGRPTMLAVSGDSASGKTTLVDGLVTAIGAQRCTVICTDDYHRYDRFERTKLPSTPLHPDCNYIDIMEQHLQMLATGQSILKPVYDHGSGMLTRPEYVEPREYVIVEGLFPLFTKLARACFDISVFLDPPEDVRRIWKVRRDTTSRGYTEAEVLSGLELRERDSADYIRPQRRYADIILRFAPSADRPDSRQTPLAADILLRPTVQHPPWSHILSTEASRGMLLKIVRDTDGTPVDCLQLNGDPSTTEDLQHLQQVIWADIGNTDALPQSLGDVGARSRSEPLAVTQLLLARHLIQHF